jgi:hypothetical protein
MPFIEPGNQVIRQKVFIIIYFCIFVKYIFFFLFEREIESPSLSYFYFLQSQGLTVGVDWRIWWLWWILFYFEIQWAYFFILANNVMLNFALKSFRWVRIAILAMFKLLRQSFRLRHFTFIKNRICPLF